MTKRLPGHEGAAIGMKTRATTVLAALAGAAASAAAQYSATYSFVLTSPGAQGGTNGTAHIQVLPGAPVTAVVQVAMNPGIGSTWTGLGTLTGTILGLSAGSFSITGEGTTGAGSGWSSPSLIDPYNFPLGTTPGTPNSQGIDGVVWGMGFLLSSVHPLPENPGKVWTGTYTPGGAGTVNLSFTALSSTAVWVWPPGGPFPFEGYGFFSAGQSGSITVVPGPAGAALLGLGLLPLAHCRRRNRGARAHERSSTD